jgi:glycerol-3-phosphate dehydrogenase (NAD(P)+)
MADFAVLGAGAMGTAISYLLALNDYKVSVWARRDEVANEINKKKTNSEYMPGVILPGKVSATTNLKRCLESSEKVIVAVPSHGIYDLLLELRRYQISKKYWLSVVKGMVINFRSTVSKMFLDQLRIEEDKISVLSGPNFATEIVKNAPTVSILGCRSKTPAAIFREALENKYFLVRVTEDLQGVEIGGILKNIGAIAIGLLDGLDLGDNVRGLILPEYVKEGIKVGTDIFKAKMETLLGPAFLGDMVTTAFSLKSRNRLIGLLASKGITNISNYTFITEGKHSAEIIKALAYKHKINVPVIEFVCEALSGVKPYIAFNNLWNKLRESSAFPPRARG